MTEQNNKPGSRNVFNKGMNTDLDEMVLGEGSYLHARNAVNNLPDGMVFGISTEPATLFCTELPYPMIGCIPLSDDQWMLFLTDDTSSDIGIFTETLCQYISIVNGNQPCLNFSRKSLITGAARRGFDCGFDVYWSDGGRNVDRFINTAKVPFIQTCTTVVGCTTCVDTTVLDCSKLPIAPAFAVPCLKLSKGQGSGTLLNGSYQVTIAYSVNGIRCTDYIASSEVIGVWAHGGVAGAVRLSISGAETSQFTEMEVVVVSMVNFQVQAKRLGIYSTRQEVIYIDNLDLELPNVDLSLLPLSTPAIQKSDAIYSVNGYLLRLGTYEEPDFNYQPLANQIITKWACVEYKDYYYHQGGNDFGMNVGYLRDEVYSYYIRWVRTTGDKTASYHIPGRIALATPSFAIGGPGVPGSLGTVASGLMVGYESTEIYPDDQPAVWGTLCGQRIRHHKFPDQAFSGSLTHFTPNFTIRVMGVYFENIKLPVDNNGNLVPGIQGYEILRDVRDGHKSILAKGMINHMRGYIKPDGTTGLYQNYPYDDLNPDRFLTSSQVIGTVGGTLDLWQGNELTIVKSDIISFHSPDTVFEHPYLGSGNLVIYMGMQGVSQGNYHAPYNHPKFKILSQLSNTLATLIGLLVVFSDTVNIISGGATNLSLAATNDVPWITPLGATSLADGPFGSISTASYVAMAIAQGLIAAALLPLEIKIIQTQILNVVTGLVPAKQYATQYDSHGFYNQPIGTGKLNYTITDYEYIKGYLQTFATYEINNLYRNDYVALSLNSGIPSLGIDQSRFTLGQRPPGSGFGPFNDNIASYYAAYKVAQGAQYGQIGSCKQVPIGCTQVTSPIPGSFWNSPVFFGGDTYINRYTEKNPFFFFNDWLVNTPEDFQYDYTNYENVPYPRYWVNNSKVYYDFWGTASKNFHLDEYGAGPTFSFYVHDGFFYLFYNGVRDFYVESEVNVGYRDWEDDLSKRFYDPYGYTSLDYMFRSDLIKSDIYYKYDYSLSAPRFFNQYISWGQVLRRDYDPLLAYTCFAYYPRRVHYSLPQEEELRKDNWRIFLPNNYKDFSSKVIAFKQINKTGALILLENQSPQSFTGVDVLQTSGNNKITVGDGGLFDQALQTITNADDSLQYGSCQSRLGVINTPHGVFWVSQESGKIFNFTGQGLEDISAHGLKWHLAKYLPSLLLQQFPNYNLKDNPVAGIGVQLIYDNTNEVLYICKKDFTSIGGTNTCIVWAEDLKEFITCSANNTRRLGGIYKDIPIIPVDIHNINAFTPCGWTLSYDCKNKQFISWHDWYPDLNIPAKTHFLTSKRQVLWRHNQQTGLFCNFYGIDYPFEVLTFLSTGTEVTTLESVEYILDAYNYKTNQTDKFNLYDNTFDRAIVYNDEQSTGMLLLNNKPWDNPYAALNFPNFTAGGINILYTKIENKFRFNFIKDFTADRFQFGLGLTQSIITQPNGYVQDINFGYINQLKPQMQQKKMRHRNSKVFLRKSIVGFNSMTLKFVTANNLQSLR